jgi:hypothetical protein
MPETIPLPYIFTLNLPTWTYITTYYSPQNGHIARSGNHPPEPQVPTAATTHWWPRIHRKWTIYHPKPRLTVTIHTLLQYHRSVKHEHLVFKVKKWVETYNGHWINDKTVTVLPWRSTGVKCVAYLPLNVPKTSCSEYIITLRIHYSNIATPQQNVICMESGVWHLLKVLYRSLVYANFLKSTACIYYTKHYMWWYNYNL